MIFLSCDAAPGVLRNSGERSGTRERLSQEGPRNIGRFSQEVQSSDWGFSRPGQSKDQRALGPRSLVDQPGSSQEGAARWKATPELVSQDRERVGRPKGSINQVTNTGRSFARRSGGWQQCRPPFLFGVVPIGAFEPARSPRVLRYLEGQFGDEIQHENAIERLIARR